jgi:hypothetical protein
MCSVRVRVGGDERGRQVTLISHFREAESTTFPARRTPFNTLRFALVAPALAG